MTENEKQPAPQGGPFAGYSDEYKPLAQYALLAGIYNAALAASLAAAGEKRALPERLSFSDIALLGIATHKLSRLITKDWVTSPFRAPFTKFKEADGAGEVSEEARGSGMQRAIGELVTCPWCVGPWVAGALGLGMAFAPKPTRLLTAIFTAVTASDFLHHAYVKTKELNK
jgi:hypothetical protein